MKLADKFQWKTRFEKIMILLKWKENSQVNDIQEF